MDILNAILAFSVSMLVFSTMALVVVEVFYRFNRTREKYFAEMINVFFSDMIWKKLQGVDLSGFTPQQLRNDFLSIMTSVSGLVKLDLELANGADNQHDDTFEPSKQKPADSGINKTIKDKTEVTAKAATGAYVSKTTERLTTIEFAQRLARTHVGKLLLEKGEEKAKAIVLDLASQLNAISSGASADFRQRSRKASLLASAVIATALNVDAIYLFKAYTTDQALSERVIESAPAVIDAYEEQEARMDTLEAELNNMSEDAEQALQDLRGSLEDNKVMLEQSASSLKELGVPIGLNYFPYCSPVSKAATDEKDASDNIIYKKSYADSRCRYFYDNGSLTGPEKLKNTGRVIAWLAGVMLAVILIGQGSPFWFQMFQKLSMALQVVKGLSLVKSKADKAMVEAKADEQYSPVKAVEIYLQTILSESDKLDHLLHLAPGLSAAQKRTQAMMDVQTQDIKNDLSGSK